jgi:hypothetical protein
MDFFALEMVRAVSRLVGYDLTPIAPMLFAAVPTVLSLIVFLLTMRRRMAEMKQLTQTMEETATATSERTIKKFERLHDDLRNVVSDKIGAVALKVNSLQDDVAVRVESLKTFLKSTEEVTSARSDTEVVSEPPTASQPSKKTRLTEAENVRNSILQKWLSGGYLSMSSADPHVFVFTGVSLAGEKITCQLHTPYRQQIGIDGRLPFALDVWVNTRKHLNFEWNTEGSYALRGFTRGEWIEDIAHWNFPIGANSQERPTPKTQAA